MVSVVNLDDEIGDGELQLMRPELSRLVARCKFQVRPMRSLPVQSIKIAPSRRPLQGDDGGAADPLR